MSKAQDEVLSIRRKLEKMTENGDQDQAMDLLSRLRDIGNVQLGLPSMTVLYPRWQFDAHISAEFYIVEKKTMKIFAKLCDI